MHKPEWWDGWRAYHEGKSHMANPHIPGFEPRALWRAGWFAAWGRELAEPALKSFGKT